MERHRRGQCMVLGLLALLAGCGSDEVNLAGDAFVGNWDCGSTSVSLSRDAVALDGRSTRIAYIETGMNADYGLTTTDGARYSVFDTTKRSITFHSYKSGKTFACARKK